MITSEAELAVRQQTPAPLAARAPDPGRVPLISVVTVVFNGARTLRKTIESIVPQLGDDVEYVIIDGGSTDGAVDIIREHEHHLAYWISERDTESTMHGIRRLMRRREGSSRTWGRMTLSSRLPSQHTLSKSIDSRRLNTGARV